MAKRREIRNNIAEFLIFQIQGKGQGIEVYYKDKTVWCTQKAIGMPRLSSRNTISYKTACSKATLINSWVHCPLMVMMK